MTQETTIIGLMSGTSLDGLDMACVRFWRESERYFYETIATHCVPYSPEWQHKLRQLEHASALEYAHAHVALGAYFGQHAHAFIQQNNLNAQYIASHGHTIFHQPYSGITTQIGSLPHLAAACHLPTIGDFRSLDVALGGQGAPLVPVGDQLLFHEYETCINIGGIANLSYSHKNEQIAYDICPANMLINYLCQKLSLDFDENGAIAANGTPNLELLHKLDMWHYYQKSPPKSLGKEQIFEEIVPILRQTNDTIPNQIATVTLHIAQKISQEINKIQPKTVLITGGGALNTHLMRLIKSQSHTAVSAASTELINFKEAIIFAFLGYLRILNQPNCLKSVTGASHNNCGGAIYLAHTP